MPNRKTLTLLLSALLALALLIVGTEGKSTPSPTAAPDKDTITATATVTRIIDGDTIEVLLSGKSERVRYIGIDTPESVDPNRAPECFGREASAENARLVEGKTVRMEKDVSERDRYGRLLRFVYVDDMFINRTLIEGGYANAAPFPPDISKVDEFREAEKLAREERRGLWAGCEENPTEPISMLSQDCAIKGNVNGKQKIYHLPVCPYYYRTLINTNNGERWFCTEQEALAAGWRKAGNCPQ